MRNPWAAIPYGSLICRFRDKRSGLIWNAYRENGLVPRFVVTIYTDAKPVPNRPPEAKRKLMSRAAIDLTWDGFQEYLDHAEILE